MQRKTDIHLTNPSVLLCIGCGKFKAPKTTTNTLKAAANAADAVAPPHTTVNTANELALRVPHAKTGFVAQGKPRIRNAKIDTNDYRAYQSPMTDEKENSHPQQIKCCDS